MSAERLGEVEADRLEAALFEQRRLTQMLRQRGLEIEALQGERERLSVKEREARERQEQLRQQVQELEAELATGAADAERRLDLLGAELANVEHERQGLKDDLAKARRQRERVEKELRDELDEARREREEATSAAGESSGRLEETARELGRVQREIELLTARERKREMLLADSERTLEQVAEHLRRTRASRSWRWGHGLARALGAVTFRRRSSRSALDAALDRLEAEGQARARGG